MKEAIIKINKTKSWFFEKIKLTTIEPDSSTKKERRIKSTKLEMKKERLQMTMWKYKGLLDTTMKYGNKMDNLEEMDRFLEK